MLIRVPLGFPKTDKAHKKEAIFLRQIFFKKIAAKSRPILILGMRLSLPVSQHRGL